MTTEPAHIFHATLLREYDIRGVIGDTLSDADARAIGLGFGTLIRRAGGTRVAVGYDGRLSSPPAAPCCVSAWVQRRCSIMPRIC